MDPWLCCHALPIHRYFKLPISNLMYEAGYPSLPSIHTLNLLMWLGPSTRRSKEPGMLAIHFSWTWLQACEMGLTRSDITLMFRMSCLSAFLTFSGAPSLPLGSIWAEPGRTRVKTRRPESGHRLRLLWLLPVVASPGPENTFLGLVQPPLGRW